MTKEPSHGGAQTIKQAKAAFKARGSVAVSSAEQRRLERGATLLERASRLKEQEQRRKLQAKRRDEQPAKDKPVQLGTQVKLDKFGYKSSQFHLGAFLKASRRQSVAGKSEEEPWDSEDVDDDTLLDIAVASDVQHPPKPKAASTMTRKTSVLKSASNHQIDSPFHEDLSHWDDFLESSTQLERELSSEKQIAPTKSSKSMPRISSFNSVDFDLDLSTEDLEELELGFAQTRIPPPPRPASSWESASKRDFMTTSTKSVVDRKTMPPQPPFTSKQNKMDSKLMPSPNFLPAAKSKSIAPPPPRLLARSNKHPPSNRVTKPKHVPSRPANLNIPLGISLADLESLAAEDIQLTQYDGG